MAGPIPERFLHVYVVQFTTCWFHGHHGRTGAHRRSGQHPQEDEKTYAPEGERKEAVTGEVVCVRRTVDLDALRSDLKARSCRCAVDHAASQHLHITPCVCAMPVAYHSGAESVSLPQWMLCCTQGVRDQGIESVAVVLKNSYLYPDHEQEVGKLAKELGFKQVGFSAAATPRS